MRSMLRNMCTNREALSDQEPDPIDPDRAAKTYTELLKEGVPHKGGLAQLAQAEQEGGLWTAKQVLH